MRQHNGAADWRSRWHRVAAADTHLFNFYDRKYILLELMVVVVLTVVVSMGRKHMR